jgi:hypothetical protein
MNRAAGQIGMTLAIILTFLAVEAGAQTGGQTGSVKLPERVLGGPITAQGQVSTSVVGQAGQRQTKEQAAEGITPTARIASRIQNRVQLRIRNRVDRNYDPLANAISPFKVAGDQARSAARIRR